MKKSFFLIVVLFLFSWNVNAQMILKFSVTNTRKTITLPLHGTVNADVDWGDGKKNHYTKAGNYNHTYLKGGIKTVKITGKVTHFGAKDYKNADQIIAVVNFGNIGLTDLSYAFYKAKNFTDVPKKIPANITNLSYAFKEALIFNDADIASWNVSKVTNMSFMFMQAKKFNQNLNKWNVSNVTDMQSMFYYAVLFNSNITNWNVSKVKNMNRMFAVATKFNQNISRWNVGNVTDMEKMFGNADAFNQNINSWNVSKVKNMQSMFWHADIFNQDIGDWNTSSVTNFKWMFRETKAFNQDIGSWDIQNATNMTEMFRDATLSTSNYDKLLIGWSKQNTRYDVLFSGGNSKYSNAAKAAREVLRIDKLWVITDGGLE